MPEDENTAELTTDEIITILIKLANDACISEEEVAEMLENYLKNK